MWKMMISLSLVLALSSFGLTQTPTPAVTRPVAPKPPPTPLVPASVKKSSLEDALAEALKNNPDLKVAAAKVNEAEAQLLKTRLLVAQKVVLAQYNLDLAEATAKTAEQALARIKLLKAKIAASAEELQTAELAAVQAKTKVAAAKTELAYLLGKSSLTTAKEKLGRIQEAETTKRLWRDWVARAQPVTQPKGEAADTMRKALDKKVTVDTTPLELSTLLSDYLQPKQGMVLKISKNNPVLKEKIGLQLKDMPLGAVLQFVEDSLDGQVFVVREYGLLLVPSDKAPPGAMTMTQFWKGDKKETKATTAAPKK